MQVSIKQVHGQARNIYSWRVEEREERREGKEGNDGKGMKEGSSNTQHEKGTETFKLLVKKWEENDDEKENKQK